MLYPLGTSVDAVEVLGFKKFFPTGPPPVGNYFRTDTENVASLLFDTVSQFTVGSDELGAWRNGVHLLLSDTIGDAIDRYEETNNQTLTLEVITALTDVMTAINDPDTSTVQQLTNFTGTTQSVPTYVIGSDRLLNFRNGLLMVNSLSIGDANSQYQETTTTSLTLQLAASLVDVFRTEILATSPVFREDFDGQSGLTLTTVNGVTASDDKLNVFRNGALMYEGATLGDPVNRYTITGANQITLEVAAVTGDRWTALKRN